MASFPTHPRYARMLLAAHELGCVRAAALIAALSQSRNILLSSEGKRMDETREEILGGEGESDFFTLMRAWRFAQGRQFDHAALPAARHSRRQRARSGRDARAAAAPLASAPGSMSPKSRPVRRRSSAASSPDFPISSRGGSTRARCAAGSSINRTGELVRDSVVRKSALFVAGEIREVESRDELRVLLSQATAVEESWLREAFPDDFSEGTQTLFDPNLRRVVTRRTRLFRDLVLDFTEQDATDAEAAARLLAEEVLSGRCPLKNWDDAVEQWFVRLACLRDWMPELDLPAADDEAKRVHRQPDLPRRVHLQGDQGRGGHARAARVDHLAGPALARPIRAGAAGAARRPQGEGHLHRRAARR